MIHTAGSIVDLDDPTPIPVFERSFFGDDTSSRVSDDVPSGISTNKQK